MNLLHGTRLSGHIARNTRTPLYEEDEGGPLPRTRISARYSLDRWSVERERERDDAAPDRGDGNRRELMLRPLAKTKKANGRPKRFVTNEQVLARPVRFYYQLVKIVTLPNTAQRQVLAKCIGPSCDGFQRRFELSRWVSDATECKSCQLCARHFSLIKQQEEVAEKTSRMNGRYEFVRFKERAKSDHKTFVIGRCTGPICGGVERMFSLSHWNHQYGAAGLGCVRCANAERTKRSSAAIRLAYSKPQQVRVAS